MKSHTLRLRHAFGVLALGFLAQTAMADDYLYGFSAGNQVNNLTVNGSSIILSNSNQGWWSPQSSNSSGNDNFIVGNQGSTQWNNFFTFDITGLSSVVTSAVLNLQFFQAYSSSGSALTYSLFDVSTAAGTLNNNNGTSQSIYDDLGSGVSYGSFSVATNQGYNDVVSFNLNAAGVAGLNNAISSQAQTFSIGGTLSPSTNNSVPDGASSLALFGFAAAALCVARRKLA